MNYKKDNIAVLKPNRIEALSDGVFAIVMTLLVIELSVPIVSNHLFGVALSPNLKQ